MATVIYEKKADAIAGDQEKMPTKSLLPSDLIFEILIWTDIEYMPILKQVCKDWRNLLSHPTFITSHHQRSKVVYRGYILRPLFKEYHSGDIFFVSHLNSPSPKAALNINFLPETVKMEASTAHGLLYCVGSNSPSNHYVCKPTTKQWTTIPKPTVSHKCMKIAMVDTIKDDDVLWFKILRIPSYKRPVRDWEVFDSETWKWTQIKNLGVDGSIAWGTMVNGCYCWLEPTSNYTEINAFDVWREELSTLELAPELCSNTSKSLASLDGNQLCLIYPLLRELNKLKAELWVMTSMEDRRWERRWAFDFHEDFNLGETTDFANVIIDGIFLVQTRDYSWYNLNLNDKTRSYVKVDNRVKHSDTLLFFQSDYLPCIMSQLQQSENREMGEESDGEDGLSTMVKLSRSASEHPSAYGRKRL